MTRLQTTRRSALLLAGIVPLSAFTLTNAAIAQTKLTKVTFRTDYRFNGWIAPFSLALERGYYRDLGIDLQIGQGSGSGTTVQTVGSGADDFGLADAATVLLGVSARDIPVILTSVYLQTNVVGLIYRPSSGFDGDLKKLKGPPVVSSAGAADLTLLQPALSTVGMTLNDVDLRLVDFNARIPVFLQTRNAVLTGFAAGDFLRARLKDAEVKFKPYADYGIIAYSSGLIAQRKTVEENPELVRKMVAASAKGWEDTIKDPTAAINSGLKLFPDLDAKMVTESLNIVLSSELNTAATKGHPIGWTAESDWVAMINVLTKYSNMKAKPPSHYYTNRFIATP